MNLLSKLADIIYPPRCHVCHAFVDRSETGLFCPDCFSDFTSLASPLCPVCSTPFVSDTQTDHLCEECLRDRPSYSSVFAAYQYKGALVKAVYRFKYGAKGYLAESLGLLLAEFSASLFKEYDDLLVIPVPLHPKRLRERGFNQSLLLARHVGGRLSKEVDFMSLRRTRYTAPQAGLKKHERKKNVLGAFSVEKASAVEDKTILLVDDVSTTGNTLNECARILIKSGCKEVFCLVLAKAADKGVFY